jgi:hypothetical protein
MLKDPVFGIVPRRDTGLKGVIRQALKMRRSIIGERGRLICRPVLAALHWRFEMRWPGLLSMCLTCYRRLLRCQIGRLAYISNASRTGMSRADAAQGDGAGPLIVRIFGAGNSRIRLVVLLAKWDGILGVVH